jgi:EAL and modified HD-GYP domain-containing signal transduction protein
LNPDVTSPEVLSTEGPLEDIFLARQPILDRQQRLVAYELLFRSCHTNRADIAEHMRATTTLVNNAFNGMGIASVLGHAKGYINVDAHFLLSDWVELLPPKQVVLEILEWVEPSDDVIARIKALRLCGYSFALDDYSGDSSNVDRFLSEVDLVKVDLRAVDPARLTAIAADLRRRRLRMVAEKVETKDEFELACNLGFDLFQGYHFARPQLLTSKQQKKPAKIQLLRLLSLILEDSDTVALEMAFKRHPMLSYNLIRMVNSAASGLHQRVNSLRHAIVLLGRRQLQIWMQLLLYTVRDDGATDNPLLQMAATRGKLMETVAQIDSQSRRGDPGAAFMTGILSLVDVLLGMPREQIFGELLISDELKEALLFRTGRLGHLLRLAETLEQDNHAETKELIAGVPGLSMESLLQMQLESYLWANSIEQETAA